MSKCFSSVAIRTLFGIATLLTASCPVLAQSTSLVCRMNPDMPFTEDEPTIVDLNQAQNSVVVHFAATARKDMTGITGGYNGRGGNGPHTLGPSPAIYSTDTITFNNPNEGSYGNYVINRVTGIFANDSQNLRWTCQVGKPQF